MYIDLSLCDDTNKDRFIDELKFKNCMPFKIKTTSNFFVGITDKKGEFIIHAEYFDAKNIFSHQFLHNIKHIPNVFQHLSKPIDTQTDTRTHI